MSTRRVLLVLLVCASPFIGLTFAAMLTAWLGALFSPGPDGSEIISFVFGLIGFCGAVVAAISLALNLWHGSAEGRP